jgi:hypothetical protein
MAKIWKSEELVWKRDGFIKKSAEILLKKTTISSGQVKELIWYDMVQRFSEYRFFDVNCILSIVFQVQFQGCPGKPKFQFHILCGGRTLYIYTCIYYIFNYIHIYSHNLHGIRQAVPWCRAKKSFAALGSSPGTLQA